MSPLLAQVDDLQDDMADLLEQAIRTAPARLGPRHPVEREGEGEDEGINPRNFMSMFDSASLSDRRGVALGRQYYYYQNRYHNKIANSGAMLLTNTPVCCCCVACRRPQARRRQQLRR